MKWERWARLQLQQHRELLWFISEACGNVCVVFVVLGSAATVLGADAIADAASAPALVLLTFALPSLFRQLERATW